MARRRPPVWTTRSSRFAGLPPRWAGAGLGVTIALMLAGLTTLWNAVPVAADTAFGEAATREAMMAGVRAGGAYYEVIASIIRSEGGGPRAWSEVPLPGLARLLGASSPLLALAMQWTLVLAVFAAWFARLRTQFARLLPIAAVGFLLAAGLVQGADPLLASLHPLWAGLGIALSLAMRRPGRWLESVAIGLVAIAIEPAAALYAIVMAGLAQAEGERREAIGWTAGLLIFAALFAVHGMAIADIAPGGGAFAFDPAFGGYGLAIQSFVLATTLQALPLPLATILVALALIGWASWRDPAGLRATATIAAYTCLIGLFSAPDSIHWGFLVAPLLPLGLAFAPDALRDLIAALLDRRRVRVQRISR